MILSIGCTSSNQTTITNFEECAAASYPVMESYPEQCRDAKGNLFVQIIDNPNEIPIPVTNVNNQAFNQSIVLKLNQTVGFTDGLTVSLKEINDSRCPADVQCIWAGELSALFSATNGKLNSTQEVRLGTVNNKSAVVQGYSFILKDTAESSVTIRVSPPNLK